MTAHRPLRSVLYVPASNARATEKAAGLPVDAVILDLEDAVAPEAKEAARDALAAALGRGFGARATIVRVNGAGTPWHEADVAAVARLAPDAVLLPKAGSAADLAALADRLGGAPGGAPALWAMIETPAGVLAAPAIAAEVARRRGPDAGPDAGPDPAPAALVMGTNDLAEDLGARDAPGRAPLLPALGLCVLAARAAGVACLDGVHPAPRDEAGLAAACAQGRDMGFDGKTLIHPAQVAIANAAFTPSPEEVDAAHRRIAAFERAARGGRGVAVLDGRIVEGLHAEADRALIARAEAIAARGAA